MKRIAFLLLISFFVSCQQEKGQSKKDSKLESVPSQTVAELEEKLDLDEAIIKTPPSIVSITSSLDIEFRDPVVSSHLGGSILDKTPFTFDPEINGHAKWLSQRILRFVPDENLPAGKTVKGTLYGKTLLGEQRKVNDLQFSFKVAEQEVISLEGDFIAVPEEKNSVTYTGTITFAQPVDVNKIKNDLVFKGPLGKIELIISQDEQREKIKLTSASLTRELKGKNFTFSLPGRYTANKEEWEKSVFLTGIGVFRVLSHMDMTNPEADQPTYAFRFNDPIKKKY